MTHHLINTETLTLATAPVGGNPVIRRIGTLPQINEGLPDGYAYVPDLPRPDYDAETQRIERELTPTSYGWRIVDLSAEEQAAIQQAKIPQEVTRRQMLLALLQLPTPITRAEIRAMLATEEALVEYEEAQTFRRDHPLVNALAYAKGLTSSDLDNLFTAASTL